MALLIQVIYVAAKVTGTVKPGTRVEEATAEAMIRAAVDKSRAPVLRPMQRFKNTRPIVGSDAPICEGLRRENVSSSEHARIRTLVISVWPSLTSAADGTVSI
jgi:hypothetical protein